MKQEHKRKALAEAFMEMINDTPLNGVRIREFCERGKISKPTF